MKLINYLENKARHAFDLIIRDHGILRFEFSELIGEILAAIYSRSALVIK